MESSRFTLTTTRGIVLFYHLLTLLHLLTHTHTHTHTRTHTQGADVNELLPGGRRPLHYAADSGHLEVIKYLVSKGAEVDGTDKHGITPVLAAMWEGHTSTVAFLLESGASKEGKGPDGTPYAETSDVKPEIIAMFK